MDRDPKRLQTFLTFKSRPCKEFWKTGEKSGEKFTASKHVDKLAQLTTMNAASCSIILTHDKEKRGRYTPKERCTRGTYVPRA